MHKLNYIALWTLREFPVSNYSFLDKVPEEI